MAESGPVEVEITFVNRLTQEFEGHHNFWGDEDPTQDKVEYLRKRMREFHSPEGLTKESVAGLLEEWRLNGAQADYIYVAVDGRPVYSSDIESPPEPKKCHECGQEVADDA